MHVKGLFGHVQDKHVRSLIMFLGFVVAMQIAMAVILTIPIFLSDKSNLFFINPAGYFEKWGFRVLAISLAIFAFRYLLHSLLMEKVVGIVALEPQDEPRLARIVSRIAAVAGVPTPGMGLIVKPEMNAFACGLSQSDARVIVTQGLLDGLTDDELEAVVAHEIAHIKNGDVSMMAIANASLGSIDFLCRKNPLRFRGWKTLILCIIIMPLMFLFSVMGVATHLAMTIGKASRLMIASSREYIADAEAVRLTHKPAALVSALRKINGRSQIPDLDPMTSAMMIDGPSEGEFASHPTVEDRIAVLNRTVGSMMVGAGGQRDTRFGLDAFVYASTPDVPEGVSALASKPRTRNIIDLVNIDNDRNVFGLKKTHGKFLIGFVICVFIIPQFCQAAMMAKVSNDLKSTSPSVSVGLEAKANPGELTPKFEAISSMLEEEGMTLDDQKKNEPETEQAKVPQLRGLTRKGDPKKLAQAD